MSQFRAAKLDIGCFTKIRNIRDHTKRKVYSENEPERQALRYIIRNSTLPQRVRAQAQLQLSQMHCYTRFTQIKNRCIMGGKGRGVFSDFRLGRYQFRVNALAGNLPGIRPLAALSRINMFRRIEDSLEPDPSFPADLNQLGFFINKSGHIRMIKAPEKPYVFRATNNERVNEVLREAMQTCQRKEAEVRLFYLGLNCIHLPKFATDKPNGPHVPILAPAPETLKTRKRVIVLVNDSVQDLGILAYRQLQRELGINGGSVVNFVKEIIKRSSTDNTAEKDADISRDGYKLEMTLLYSHKYDQAMTMRSWSAMPRKSIVHDMIRIDEEENHVVGQRTAKEHVRTVFDQVICNPERVAADAEVYVIAIEDGSENILKLLAEDFDKYGTRITAMALVHSLIDDSQIKDPHLRAFLHQRARQWKFSERTSNPLHCTDLPEHYHQDASKPQISGTFSVMHSTKHIPWHEDVPQGPVASMNRPFHRLILNASPPKMPGPVLPAVDEANTKWASGQAVTCPTFGGGNNPVGECVFSNPSVQHAILAFFEDVAQDPENYRNPPMKLCTEAAPQPSPDNPLAFSADDANIHFPPTLTNNMTPEQADLDSAREDLVQMRKALSDCPPDIPALQPGSEKLETKIRKLESRVQDLEYKALGAGGLGAGEAAEKRQSWEPQVEGPQVPFAGTMVDSELLKAAGLMGARGEETASV
ncbi:ribosomal protein s14 protein [Stemphylium lycopersici]|uniref:Ribosomal protein s14 protein n=1 Tax=Stemphylium lycopersici TaxID=183478 RepID=A0A364MZP7_STELY|nr:ribosomal protein s14 protein [Stemphylium lycopersici]RAR08009.1 ribosomal protein s14 protein [Stemphylium lycopersici]